MLNIYARTFMIATMTDPSEDGRGARVSPRRRSGADRAGWLGGAWRRLAGRGR